MQQYTGLSVSAHQTLVAGVHINIAHAAGFCHSLEMWREEPRKAPTVTPPSEAKTRAMGPRALMREMTTGVLR